MRYRAIPWVAGAAWLAFACGSSQHTQATATAGRGSGADAASTGGSGTSGSNAESGNTSGGASNAAPIALADLCPVFTHDLCVYLMQCSGASYKDAAHCERELSCFGLPELTKAAANGAVAYDPGKVGACHERFMQSPCDFGFFLFTPDIYDVLAYCPGTVTPKQKAGAACSANGECSDGLYCYKGKDYQCPGTCKAFSQQGEDCAGSARCAKGFSCNNNLCAPEAKAGSSCLTSGCSYSVSCPGDQVCPDNIWCDRAADKCTPGRLEGETCGEIGTGATASTAECAINLWCDGLGVSSGSCRKPSVQGGPCGLDPSGCVKGQHCVGYAPFGPNATLGTCQPPGPMGSDCNGSGGCQAGLVCVSSHCRAPGAVAAACNNDVDCQSGLVCVNNLCAAARYPGDSCDAGRCTYARCVNGTCDYHAKVGEACAAPTDCATGQCVAGLCYDDSLCKAPAP